MIDQMTIEEKIEEANKDMESCQSLAAVGAKTGSSMRAIEGLLAIAETHRGRRDRMQAVLNSRAEAAKGAQG